MSEVVAEVKNLKTYFYTDDGVVKAVDDVSFSIRKGRTLGIVGESGSGKSIASLSMLRLIQSPPGRIVGGEVLLKGKNLLNCTDDEMRKVRGNEIAMIFQEPMTSLNPVMKVGFQVAEALRLHQGLSKTEARQKAIELLRVVRIPNPEKRYGEYPHQLSGGMRQRVMIAMALSCDPEVLICDEPTTALDVTMQAQILELINDLREKLGSAIVMITHDMGVIAETADEVIVMYAGKIMESAPADDLFQRPMHPYTIGLLNSIPKLHTNEKKLMSIRGTVPKPTEMPAGCPFNPRCDFTKTVCRTERPDAFEADGRLVACWKCHSRWEEDAG
ncbi:MAG: ABC transporter ATP-binding protein [Clostridia bacterium]|nr:ABC transporter ATP-binding protein [Clostridia bacterium]